MPFRPKRFRSSNPLHASRRKTSILSTLCTDRVAQQKKFVKPKSSLTTPENNDHTLQQLRCWLGFCRCCSCSHRVNVWQLVLRPPPARTAIRWQECVFSMTFWKNRCCCSARFANPQRIPTPQPRRSMRWGLPTRQINTFGPGKGTTETCAWAPQAAGCRQTLQCLETASRRNTHQEVGPNQIFRALLPRIKRHKKKHKNKKHKLQSRPDWR